MSFSEDSGENFFIMVLRTTPVEGRRDVDLYFIILSIRYLRQRPKFKSMKADQFPHVTAYKFLIWKQCELLMIQVFVFSLYGSYALLTAALLCMWAGDCAGAMFLRALFFMLYVGGLLTSAYLGNKAGKMRKRLGIELPK